MTSTNCGLYDIRRGIPDNDSLMAAESHTNCSSIAEEWAVLVLQLPRRYRQ